jgi:phenylalanyl-tRNA synthetase beta chain
MKSVLEPSHDAEESADYSPLRASLSTMGFHEIISYSFIDKNIHELLDPGEDPLEVVNPITAEMNVMRTNLWAGLINTFIYNKSRQQHRLKLFEIGNCFLNHDDGLKQPPRVAGLISGPAFPDQWGENARDVDFYDMKGFVDRLLKGIYPREGVLYHPDNHPALHPGQTAGVFLNGNKIGVIGALHPAIQQNLDTKDRVFLFELDLSALPKQVIKAPREISRFPEIRRDLAILVQQTVPALVIQDTIKSVAGDWLKECFIFDVYQGSGVAHGFKSVALALILQHPERTLIDEEVVALTDRVVQALREQLRAELRS